SRRDRLTSSSGRRDVRMGLRRPPAAPRAAARRCASVRPRGRRRPRGGLIAVAEVTMVKALNEALRHALSEDERTLVLGEDIGKLGGVFRVTEGLQAEFGTGRVFDTPLAEAAIAGVSLGLALAGWRPVAAMQFDGSSYPALDQ